MIGAACFMPRNALRTSTPMVLSQPSTDKPSIGPPGPGMPALLKRQSSRPKTDSAKSIAPCTAASWLTSACW